MEEQKYDKLDILYNSSVRCPYCHMRIRKYTNTCPRCGIQKQQVFYASNQKAQLAMKNHTGEKVFLTMRRPNDVSFTGMILCLVFGGWFGLHCFRVGRWIRGTSIAILFAGGVIVSSILVKVNPDLIHNSPTSKFLGMFPTLWCFVIGASLILYDVAAIVFAFFKYPVRLGEAINVKTK